MRILFLNQFYIPDVAATGQLLADVAEQLAAQGHEVHVICSRRTYSRGEKVLPAIEVINDVHVHRVTTTGFGRGSFIGRTIDYFSFYVMTGWRALRLSRPDVCVSLTTPPFISLIGWILSRLKGTRSVIWAMDLYPDIAVAYGILSEKALFYRLLTRLNSVLYRDAAAVISLGETMTERLKLLGVPADSLHTVHNWVPSEQIASAHCVPIDSSASHHSV
jgi:glycosyltransferase involved in cell wall biosynthesis